MQVRHFFPSSQSRAEVEGDRAFLQRNAAGDLLTFYTQRQTRYEGWFLWRNQQFYKILEHINLLPADNSLVAQRLTNTETNAHVGYSNKVEVSWQLLPEASGLSIQLSEKAKLQLLLDMRSMYHFPQFNRSYQLTIEPDGILVRYQDQESSQPLFLAIHSSGLFSARETWHEVDYPRDRARHSSPEKLYAFLVGECTTKFIALGAGLTAAEARLNAQAASKQRLTIPSLSQSYTHDAFMNQITAARTAAELSLRKLHGPQGMWAGLPWFHQVWTRDELITALGLSADEQRAIIERYMKTSLLQGEFPTYQGSTSTCADGLGWFCLLVKEHGLTTLPPGLRSDLLQFLRQARSDWKTQRQAHHIFLFNQENATWMDTIGRSGFRLEIQCMYALLLELLYALSKQPEYEQERLSMLGKIRQHFWQGSYLVDGLTDLTLRPTIFLAYLLQPDILSSQSWQLCFETALHHLILPWGGLSSISQEDSQFQPLSTGEDNLSYHNGDSWFFINNLAAIALHRFNEHRFGKIIVNLLQSSTEEILWHNMVGEAGEISSAHNLDSWGCGAQAFSAGSYLALLHQMESYQAHMVDPSSFWDSSSKVETSRKYV